MKYLLNINIITKFKAMFKEVEHFDQAYNWNVQFLDDALGIEILMNYTYVT